ncbi:hypothetical protein OJ253_1217 [Cryptosporidium canis]|uniref:Uncharacterized protein n=1 Tax=Cryptosporidium canis TaxID=195482 RepID=A0A9D5DKJ5_9CRYT|nr:hypothetical protein OJ253_1217 [Cryptosporidium canis]
MDLSDVTATVKTAFCNTQIAEAFAAAVVASSKGKENVIRESYDLEIRKLSNELKALKSYVNEIQESFLNISGLQSNSVESTEAKDGIETSGNSASKLSNDKEWEAMKKYIYEHFRNQTEIQTKVKEIEDCIINGKEITSIKNNEIEDLGKNLEASIEHITTLAYLLDNQKDKICTLEEKVCALERKLNDLDEKFTTNLQLSENVTKLTDSIMSIFRTQSESWENFCKVIKQLSRDADHLIKRNAGTFEENSNADELALLFKRFIGAMQDIRPINLIPNT